jgi:mono/diheme cytochrome c family protein
MNSVILLGTLAALYLFVMFSTPVKAPAHVKVVEEAPVTEVAKTEEAHGAAPTAETGVHEVAVEEVNIEKGKTLFMSNCISCHNKDPNIKGAIGPELTDAPLEVMMVKVKTGRYPDVLPAGFVPKRKTKQMRKFPNLEKDVPSIHAWIQSVKK